jgi:hypothetical protein
MADVELATESDRADDERLKDQELPAFKVSMQCPDGVLCSCPLGWQFSMWKVAQLGCVDADEDRKWSVLVQAGDGSCIVG